MLKNSFIHLGGIGLATERKLWNSGIRCWEELRERGLVCLPESRRAPAASKLADSVRHYDAGNWNFFDRALPSSQKWRAFGDFRPTALFLDIETTGLTDADSITMIGAYNGSQTKTFIAGINLEEAAAEISRYPLLATFNGACFDLPVIRRRFPQLVFNHIHVDLRYALHWLGFHGGLKVIEKHFHIERSPETRGLDGWDAVRLWYEYLRGSTEALELLKMYNGEDTRNLKTLLETVFAMGSQKIGFFDIS